jgi:lactate permease
LDRGAFGLGSAIVVAAFVYRMPPQMIASATLYGAAQGLLPIGWIVFTAILLYRLTVETGQFEIIKDSIGSLTGDQRLQALLIAFAFGAFIEGGGGIRDTGRGRCGDAHRAWDSRRSMPREFVCWRTPHRSRSDRSGTPLVMLQYRDRFADGRLVEQRRTHLRTRLFVYSRLPGAGDGRHCPRCDRLLPAAAACGIAFAPEGAVLVSNYLGPSLTDIWARSRRWRSERWSFCYVCGGRRGAPEAVPHRYTTRQVSDRVEPVCAARFIRVAVGTIPRWKAWLDYTTTKPAWPGLHQMVCAGAGQ